jgi:hypothetical protein
MTVEYLCRRYDDCLLCGLHSLRHRRNSEQEEKFYLGFFSLSANRSVRLSKLGSNGPSV